MTNQQLQYELLVYRSLKMESLLNVVHKLTAQNTQPIRQWRRRGCHLEQPEKSHV